MKIAIASDGETEESKVSHIGGRAPYYLIFNEAELVKVIKNPFSTGGGAGVKVAEMLSNEKVELVISEKFGPIMVDALVSQKMQCKEISGITVKQILSKILNKL